ncbi:hypothetical protein CJU94_00115 [Paraburkholderia aromaticivorans]|uniref:Uncharacterized protein n=1 Tax=Paraburkholderia aromaticivorans TaxID=2026199 RepID=A0A248VDR4_9BURK|nr:hypothetical protein CJU94_00115 [Paraburkholderia aromaticivorans]
MREYRRFTASAAVESSFLSSGDHCRSGRVVKQPATACVVTKKAAAKKAVATKSSAAKEAVFAVLKVPAKTAGSKKTVSVKTVATKVEGAAVFTAFGAIRAAIYAIMSRGASAGIRVAGISSK